MQVAASSVTSLLSALQADSQGDAYALPDALDRYVRAVVQQASIALEQQRPGGAQQLHAALQRSSAGGVLRRDFPRLLPAELTAKILHELDGESLRRFAQCSRASRTAVHTALSPGHERWLSLKVEKTTLRFTLPDTKYGGPLMPCPIDARLRAHANPAGLTIYRRHSTEDHIAVQHWPASLLGGEPTGALTWAPDGGGVGVICRQGEKHHVCVLDSRNAAAAPITLRPAPELGMVLALAWSEQPNHLLAVVGSDATLGYDLRVLGEHVFAIPCSVRPYYAHRAARWACTQPYFALCDDRGFLQVWDLAKPEAPRPAIAPVHRMGTGPALAWHPMRSELVAADRHHIHLMRMGRDTDVDCAKTPVLLPSNNFVTHRVQLAFEPTGHDALLAVVYDHNLAFCAPATSGLSALRYLDSAHMNCIAEWMIWSDDGALEMASSGQYAWAVERYCPGPDRIKNHEAA